jgi:hypothetical protein
MPFDDRDRGAHARERLAELEADRAAAEHQQPARQLGDAGGLAVRPERRRARAGPGTGGMTASEPVASTTSAAL